MISLESWSIWQKRKNGLLRRLRRRSHIGFYYHNTETGEKKIQLLAPLYMAGAPVRLAMVLDRRQTAVDEHYEAITVIPVDWAYMNSRVIVRPEEEWAKIVDEVDVSSRETDPDIEKENTVDNS